MHRKSPGYAKNFEFRIIPADSTKVVDLPTPKIFNAKIRKRRANKSEIM